MVDLDYVHFLKIPVNSFIEFTFSEPSLETDEFDQYQLASNHTFKVLKVNDKSFELWDICTSEKRIIGFESVVDLQTINSTSNDKYQKILIKRAKAELERCKEKAKILEKTIAEFE